MRVKSVLAAAFCVSAVAAVGAGPAFAGEVTGNGDPTAAPANANSICAFSGQNDGEPPPGRTADVQSWGQIPKAGRDALRAEGSAPGDACNGHINPRKGG